jgi:hypothetical protein
VRLSAVALVAPATSARQRIAQYLRDRAYDVFEYDELSIARRFMGVVLLDTPDTGALAIAQVRSWIASTTALYVVVVTAKPTGWTTLAQAFRDHLAVLAAPAFAWEIVDALRTGHSARPVG